MCAGGEAPGRGDAVMEEIAILSYLDGVNLLGGEAGGDSQHK